MRYSFTNEGKVVIHSSVESKREQGYREASSHTIYPPSDGMIEFHMNLAEGECIKLWMTCETARNFCNAFHHAIRHHEEMGVRNTYPPRKKAQSISQNTQRISPFTQNHKIG